VNPGSGDGLAVDVQHRDGASVLTVRGVMDYWNILPLREAVEEAVADEAPRLVLDLGAVTFVDSTGLALLITADDSMRRRGGSLCVVHPGEQLTRLLQITNLDARLPVQFD
jgi:anti-sigma B factor antagonist